MREEGYYWVKPKKNEQVSGDWMIMRWTGTCFWYEDEDYHDDDFIEIDENRITREPGKFIFSTEPIEFPDLTPEKDPDFISNKPEGKLFGLL